MNLGKNLYKQAENKYFLINVIVLSLIAAVIIQILFYLKGYFSFSGDESDRTLLAYYWLADKMPKGEPWLPFHTIINGIALKYFYNLFWTPRIIGFIFGLLSISAIIWFTYNLFKDKLINIVSALFSVLFPPFVILRAVPLSEVMYFFFVITGGIFFYKWIERKENKNLILASLLFGIASSVRYEGWIFSGSLMIILIFKRFLRKEITTDLLILAILILSAFPVFWIIKNLLDTGNPLSFIASSSERYKLRYGFSLIPLLKYNLITQFIYQNILYINFIGCISLLFFLFTDKKIREWSILFFLSFLFLAILSFLGYAMPSHAYWRIPLIWSILLIPFTAHFIVKSSGLISELINKRRRTILAIIISSYIIYFSFQIDRIISFSYFSKDDISAGDFIQNQLLTKENDFKILIDTYDWNYLNVMVASNHPEAFIINQKKDPVNPPNPIIDPQKNFNTKSLSDRNIKYFLIEEKNFNNYLKKRERLRTVNKFGEWELYKLDF